MRRNKPRQRGVREARPAGGAGRAGAGPVVPAQVREAAPGPRLSARAPPAALRRNFLPDPSYFLYQHTPREHSELLPPCLPSRPSPRARGGKRSSEGPEGRARPGEAFCCFRGNRRGRRSPLSPRRRAVARTFRGLSPDDTRETTLGKFRGSLLSYKGKRGLWPNCACCCFLCVDVWEGGSGGARFVLVGGGGFWGW